MDVYVWIYELLLKIWRMEIEVTMKYSTQQINMQQLFEACQSLSQSLPP